MMDRKKADELPKMQCGFIDFVCSFVYKVNLLFFLVCETLSGHLVNLSTAVSLSTCKATFKIPTYF